MEQNNLTKGTVYNLRIKLPLKILIVLFWLGQIWTTPYGREADFDKYNYNKIIAAINGVLEENTLVGNRFALYEVVLLLLGFYLFLNYRGRGIEDRNSKRFFFVSFIVVFVSYLNPNNAFDQLRYLLTNDSRILLFFVFLLYVFLSIDKKYIGSILYNFLKYGFVIALSQALISSALFLMGSGIVYIETATTLPNAEILNVLILFSSISLSLFFKTKKISFLLILFAIHFTVLFSDRRTPSIAMFVSDLFIFIYYNKISFSLVFKLSAICIIGFAAYYLLISNEKIDLQYHLLRLYTIFTSSSYQGTYLNDMGHFEQTSATFNTLFNNLFKFWGAGMRNTYFYVEGQSVYIHNNFVAVWALYGLQMTLFLFYVLFVYVKNSLVLFKESFLGQKFPIKSAVVFSSLMILIGDAFTGEYFSKHFCYVSLFVLIITFLRLTAEDENNIILLFSGKKIGKP